MIETRKNVRPTMNGSAVDDAIFKNCAASPLRAEPPPTPPIEPVPAPAPPKVIALEVPYSRRKKFMPCLIDALLTTKKRLAL
jgi:hypothetical protein